ncbi:MAG: hypothetical protein ACOYM1_10730 [Methylovulum sp.]
MQTDKLTNQAFNLFHIIRVASNEARTYSDRKVRLCDLTIRSFRRFERRQGRFFDFISRYPSCSSSDLCQHWPNTCDCLIKPDGVGRSLASPSGVLGQGGTQ